MRLPNGYGSVTKLKGKRRNPWMVRKWDNQSARYVTIGYGRTKKDALDILSEYNRDPYDLTGRDITVKELYEMWKEAKLSKFGSSRATAFIGTFRVYYPPLADNLFRDVKIWQVQEVIDRCGKGAGVQQTIRTLWKHLENFARERELSTSSFADLITVSDTEVKRERTVFSEEEIKTLWQHTEEPYNRIILIFLYTGFRLSEVLGLKREDTDLENGTLKGGVKTTAGKNRVVPIHHRIRPFIDELYTHSVSGYLVEQDGASFTNEKFRSAVWLKAMKELCMNHVPHETRHTFRSRLDSAGANKVCIDRLMGHKSKDTGERVYTHKSLDELREAIELLL